MRNRTTRMAFSAVRAAALTLAVAGLMLTKEPSRYTQEFHQTYRLNSHGAISLENINGSVQITGWDRDEVKIDAIKAAQDHDTLNRVQISVNSSPGGLYIKTEFPHDFFGRHGSWRVNFTLMAPKGATVDKVDLVNGGAEIQDLSGDVHVSSVNGRIQARNLTGAVHLSAVNGTIDASLETAGFSNPVSISTVNGPITVTLSPSARAQVTARTVNGSIENGFGWPVSGHFVGHSLEGKLGGGGAHIELSSVNGAINIRSQSTAVE